jgi:hypothetical protein
MFGIRCPRCGEGNKVDALRCGNCNRSGVYVKKPGWFRSDEQPLLICRVCQQRAWPHGVGQKPLALCNKCDCNLGALAAEG